MSTDTKPSQYSEPPYAKNPSGTDLPWYVPNIDKYLIPTVTNVLEQYSKVPHDRLSSHIHAIRDKTYAIRSYPAVGVGVFITPYISMSPAYDEVLTILKNGGKFLDIGAMLGVDIRKLTFDGVPSENIVALDIIPDFWDVGFELYRDKDTFKARFGQADLLSLSDNPEFTDLKGKLDVVSLSAVLHQFDWDIQATALKQVVAFSKVGMLLVGHQIGNRKSGTFKFSPTQTPIFKHNAESFKDLWKQVCKETGTEWEVQAEVKTWDDFGWDANDMLWMKDKDEPLGFVVRRIS